jgi:hypothetical protein
MDPHLYIIGATRTLMSLERLRGCLVAGTKV